MKKIFVSIGVVVAIALYALLVNQPKQSTVVSNPENNQTTTPANSQNTGAYKDGTYTGPLTNAIYGKIQVVATIKNGRITEVQVPVYPDEGGHTLEVSQESLPILKQEVIQIQSANVNIISGATQTVEGFQQSLKAALAMAK